MLLFLWCFQWSVLEYFSWGWHFGIGFFLHILCGSAIGLLKTYCQFWLPPNNASLAPPTPCPALLSGSVRAAESSSELLTYILLYTQLVSVPPCLRPALCRIFLSHIWPPHFSRSQDLPMSFTPIQFPGQPMGGVTSPLFSFYPLLNCAWLENRNHVLHISSFWELV